MSTTISTRLRQLWDPNDILDSLWRICASPYFTVLILLSLAILVSLGTVLPQRSKDTLLDPVANSLWLATVRERYGSAADQLMAAAFFDLYGSVWLRSLLGLLALNMSLAAIQVIFLETSLPRDGDAAAPTFARSFGSQEEYAQWSEHLRSTLRNLGYAVKARSDRWWFVGRHARDPLALLLGVLLVLGGLAVGERTAWWESGVALRPGQSLQLGHGTGLTLHVESLETINSASATSQVVQARTIATLARVGREAQPLLLQSYRPAWRAGLWFHQTLTAPALLVQSRDSSGRFVTLQTSESGEGQAAEVYLRFRDEATPSYMIVLDLSSSTSAGRSFEQKGNEKWLWVPARDIALHVAYFPPSAVISHGTWMVQAYRGAETSPFFDSQFQASADLDIGGDHYSFVPERYTVIRYGHDWGVFLVFGGVALLVLGWILLFVRAPAAFWIRLQPTPDSVTLRFRSDTSEDSASWFQTTLAELTTGLELRAVEPPELSAEPSPRGVGNAAIQS